VALALAAAACGPAPPIAVMSWNVHVGKDAEGRGSLARVAAVIRASDADLILLQEVDSVTERSGGVDQLRQLAERTGHWPVFGRTLDFQGGGYGIGVLSRWPVRSAVVVPLPVTPPDSRAGGSHEPRGALVVRIRSPYGDLTVVNTHLSADPSDSMRVQEMRRLVQLVDSVAAAGGPVLVGGDLNAEPEGRVVAALAGGAWQDAWPTCGQGRGETYPATDPVKRIDYLFLPPEVGCLDAQVLNTAASDHRPVLLRVALP